MTTHVQRASSPKDGTPARAPFAGTDSELVEALQHDHPGALAALFDRYAAHVYRVLVRTMGPDPELGDLVHDVFLTAVDEVHGLRNADKLKSWLASITVFTARACIRKRQRWRWFSKLTQEAAPQLRSAPAFEASEALRSTYQVLNQLPVDERIAFALRFVDGMKLEEVAEACHTSLATVKRRIARGEKRFVELAQDNPVLQEWLERGTRWSG